LKQEISPAVMAGIIVVIVVIVGFVGWKMFLAKPAPSGVPPPQSQSESMMQRMRQGSAGALGGGR